ncbi:MFS transporter [Embleya sp. NBC_00896]|uniref:MFS transporter n=1 Tax=Embleya sp. NBC_00896 TaxID=2975961 RepID=UPI00386A51A8|nr:MFS transporter [Embleya sp. NBC_00896]
MSTATPTALRAAPRAPDPDAAGPTVAVVALGTLLLLTAYTMPIAIVPDTVHTLHAGLGGPAWILSAIGLGLSAALLITGSLADDLGRRRVFTAGALGLALSSALTALAPSLPWYVAGRALQGVAGAAIMSAGLGLLAHNHRGAARGRAMAAYGASIGGGMVLGPLAGAGLSLVHHSAPYWATGVAALGVAAVARRMPESRAEHPRRPDVWGTLTLGPGLIALTAALIEGRQGWQRPVVDGLMVVAVLLLAAYVAIALRSRAPMLDLRMFARPAFFVATFGALVTGVAVIGVAAYLGTAFQNTLGLSALQSALLIGLWSAVAAITSFVFGRVHVLPEARHRFAAGLLLAGVGFVGLYGLDAGDTWPRTLPGLLVGGFGVGILNTALARLAVESVAADRASMGSGANSTARYMGASIGAALVITLVDAGGMDLALLVAAGLTVLGAAVTLGLHQSE